MKTVSQKFFIGLTGFLLIGFLVTHLAGNLTLLAPQSEVFNSYAHKLQSFGLLTVFAEIGLGLLILSHAFMAIKTTLHNRKARGETPYQFSLKTKGDPSKAGLASKGMAVTGSLLLIFIFFHVKEMRFGPGIAEGYVATIAGEEVRDLYKLVTEEFSEPFDVAVYCAALILLGIHLRHGFWSLFQSLGLTTPKYSKTLHCLSFFVGLGIAASFIIIPLFIFFDLGAWFR